MSAKPCILHVRNDDGTPSSSPERFAQVLPDPRLRSTASASHRLTAENGRQPGGGGQGHGADFAQARYGVARNLLGQLISVALIPGACPQIASGQDVVRLGWQRQLAGLGRRDDEFDDKAMEDAKRFGQIIP